MPITFHPNPGTVLICDFDTGFQPPEIIKRRPVVVLQPRFRHRSPTLLVLPFSTVAPHPVEPFHYRIPAGRYPFFHGSGDIWAKGNLVTHVGFHRLDRIKVDGRWTAPSLSDADLAGIRQAVSAALGFDPPT